MKQQRRKCYTCHCIYAEWSMVLRRVDGKLRWFCIAHDPLKEAKDAND
jgi:hypothetical protein